MMSGRTEVRRSRRLVISSIATVGNYEYGFYWYFYLDGTMQLEVKLTGIMSTMAVDGDDPGEHARMVAPGLAAPLHQHLFNVRLDVEVDGADNAVFEVDAVPCAAGEGEPRRERVRDAATLLETELAARRDVDPSRARAPGASPTAAGATAWASRRPTSSCPAPHRRSWPAPSRASAGAPPSPPTTCGSPPSTPTSGGRRVTTRTSTRAARGCRPGPRGTARWSTPTSCCGTPSGSPMSRGPRTGRSCPWSPPASC